MERLMRDGRLNLSRSRPLTKVQNMRLHRFVFVALAFALVLPSLALAQTEAAEKFIRENHEAAQKLLARPRSPARDEALTAVLDGFLDYDEISRSSLGAEWGTKSRAQQDQFASLLKQLVERSYTSNLERTLKFEVRYLSAEDSADTVLVKTEARDRKKRRSPPVAIDYVVLQTSAGFRVVDIITDGVSLVDNYRRQFTRTLKRESWGALIDKMSRRLSEGDETSK